ncbi:formylglycine-generating enzyme family protein [Myxococcota bacterium]|nr:formylglycine-generating enzyme family protein [Myxococcota bacterium]MBU1382906.1 formylglycine-generating enzyme family protein [Myxococcota bacterium]MBU1495388.1 formylglycine-generating enzyme family protein [Myxococcota bacterium]
MRIKLFYTIFFIAIFLNISCTVDERNYRQEDEPEQICSTDWDCPLTRVCSEAGICIAADGCLACQNLPHAQPQCYHGLCLVGACQGGWFDANGLYQDGCEYECTQSNGGVEVCDQIDNDCNGKVDDGFDLESDVLNCGSCGNECVAPSNASPVCTPAGCNFVCNSGHWDIDGNPDNGCESETCTPTAGGVEICDLRDNDCDGFVDEDIVKDTAESCGLLCDNCNFPNSESACENGKCVILSCLDDCQDLNGEKSDGCEYCCTPTAGGVEICDNIDNDCNGLVDEGLLCSCPENMVLIDSLYCIDIYEASRPDATAANAGIDNSRCQSVAGVKPWANVSLQDASDACIASGKRLCTPEEWEKVCRGPNVTEYSYGNDYDTQICNGIDTYCYCGEGSSCESVTECPFAHCFHTCGASFHPEITGLFPNCTNGYGVYDITGNLWERVQGGAGRGGAYNCSNSEILHKCSYVADWGTDARTNFGFRCCYDGQ